MWRDVERQMAAAPPNSPEIDRLIDEFALLRTEYARVMDDPKRELADRSGELLEELGHLKETEELKRQESISTAPFHELADEVSASIRRVFVLGAQSEELGDRAETGDLTIEDIERIG